MARCRIAAAAAVSAAALLAPGLGGAQDMSAGPADREALTLTLYGNGLGLVKDRRRVELQQGIKDLAVAGVAPKMIADSAQMRFDADVRVLTQSLRPANLNPRRLLEAHVGRTIKLIRAHPQTGAERAVDAIVVSLQGGVIARIGEQLVSNPEGRWAFPAIPQHLRAEPALWARVESATGGTTPLDLRYLTGGMRWRAAYTANWNAGTDELRLQAWATLGNASGIDFDDADVSVVAGQVRRVSPAPRPVARGAVMMKAEAAMADQAVAVPERQSLAGYHLYKLPQRVTLKDGEEIQAALLAPFTVKAKRELVSESHPAVFGRVRGGGSGRPVHPAVRLTFTNPNDDRAMPLPAGTLRLYGDDRDGAAQFLGEDRLADTPVGADVTLSAGNAFDVTVKRRQTDFRREDRRTYEAAFSVEVHNGGAGSETVKIVETVPGDWRLEDSDKPHTREDNQAVWRIAVPANETVRFSYRVRVQN